MMNFKPSKVTLALLSSGFMALSTSALAQEAAEGENKVEEKAVEVIKVTGLRRSLALSQAVKMSSSSVVEAISAEDIGKLPDASIAESIARLPGITAQRLNGRANVVSIRGLSPDFTTATLNGREQVSVGDNRGVEFDQYPSELLGGVVIYKTPDASLMSQGIGGTVDMQTIRPLSYGKQAFAVGLRYEENDLGALNAGSSDSGERGSFSYIDQFADNTIGVAIGYAHMSSPNQEERWEAWGYPELDDGNQVLGGAKPYVRSSELERDGWMGVVEFQPNDRFHTIVDVYYSDFKETQLLRGIEIPLAWSGAQLQPGYTAENGLVTAGQYNDVMAVMRNDINIRDSEVTSLGWNLEYVLDDNWTVEADLSYSKAERVDFGLESYSGTGRGSGVGASDNIGFELTGDGGAVFSPGLDYSDSDLMKIGAPLSWGNGQTIAGDAQDGFINRPSIEDELKAIRLSAERVMDSGFISSIEFGVNYSEREKSKDNSGDYLTLNNYPDLMTVPDEYLLSPTSLDFIGMGDMLSYDSWALYKDGYYTETSEGLTVSSRATDSWLVKEEVTTAYVQINLDTEWQEMPISGNFGVQVVSTDQSSTGNGVKIEDGLVVATELSGGDKYTEVLPSLNLNFEVAEEQMLRLGISRTLARARMDQMNAGIGYDYDTNLAGSDDLNNSPWTGKGGNPELQPWLAKQYDLSYEYYLGDEGYISVAGFYKDLENYIFNEYSVYDFSDVPVSGDNPTLLQGLVEQPKNGNGGNLHGIEMTLSLTGGMFTDVLEGFGMVISGAITDSKVKENADSDPLALPGLSKKVLNATVYYENSGFEARVSSRYRSEFIGEVTGRSLSRNQRLVKGELVVDAQLGYDFSESNFDSLDGLSIQLQVNNLTDEPFTTYENKDARQVKDHQVYGRNFMLGMNYKF
ncbi:TonB-dependent receptor [Thalassomonas haliotis]|uniref:TonB-dependent receptor n=1 Tax=Thalassomonas haliotis TaxID=485448 RepID=A0ABY7VBQ1_9GAMM|nr:TonB-dependent receptor [Thalassomonas haliotis]WDE10792.1 TonB-dependent receptor [Thalassomonas haliotis]